MFNYTKIGGLDNENHIIFKENSDCFGNITHNIKDQALLTELLLAINSSIFKKCTIARTKAKALESINFELETFKNVTKQNKFMLQLRKYKLTHNKVSDNFINNIGNENFIIVNYASRLQTERPRDMYFENQILESSGETNISTTTASTIAKCCDSSAVRKIFFQFLIAWLLLQQSKKFFLGQTNYEFYLMLS